MKQFLKWLKRCFGYDEQPSSQLMIDKGASSRSPLISSSPQSTYKGTFKSIAKKPNDNDVSITGRRNVGALSSEKKQLCTPNAITAAPKTITAVPKTKSTISSMGLFDTYQPNPLEGLHKTNKENTGHANDFKQCVKPGSRSGTPSQTIGQRTRKSPLPDWSIYDTPLVNFKDTPQIGRMLELEINKNKKVDNSIEVDNIEVRPTPVYFKWYCQLGEKKILVQESSKKSYEIKPEDAGYGILVECYSESEGQFVYIHGGDIVTDKVPGVYIVGDCVVGSKLEVQVYNDGWELNGALFQWFRDGQEIVDATKNFYICNNDDQNSKISVEIRKPKQGQADELFQMDDVELFQTDDAQIEYEAPITVEPRGDCTLSHLTATGLFPVAQRHDSETSNDDELPGFFIGRDAL